MTSTRHIEVIGLGSTTAVPDCVEATLTLRHTAKDVAAVLQASLQGMADLGTILRDQGVLETDIQTSGAQINQQWDPEGKGRVIGHEAHQQVRVRIRDPKQVGKVLTEAAQRCGNALGMHGVNLQVSDPSGLAEQARAAAFTDARDKASALAELAGARLGVVLSITEASADHPVPMVRAMKADAYSGGVEAGESAVQAVLTVRFALDQA